MTGPVASVRAGEAVGPAVRSGHDRPRIDTDILKSVHPTVVRFDLTEKDHERLEPVATEKGLNMASYARMAVLAQLRKDEEESK